MKNPHASASNANNFKFNLDEGVFKLTQIQPKPTDQENPANRPGRMRQKEKPKETANLPAQDMKRMKTRKEDLANQDDWETRVSKSSFVLLNKFRQSNGRGHLKWDNSLFKVSINHSRMMANKMQISHDGFDARVKRLNGEFFVYQSAENVGYFMKSREVSEMEVARKLLDGWINSTGHRRNMLLENINHGAVAVVRLLRGGAYYYGTQFFVRK